MEDMEEGQSSIINILLLLVHYHSSNNSNNKILMAFLGLMADITKTVARLLHWQNSPKCILPSAINPISKNCFRSQE
jgi:hypothetical protein